jgi:membrane-associated phospholipid phosphatase
VKPNSVQNSSTAAGAVGVTQSVRPRPAPDAPPPARDADLFGPATDGPATRVAARFDGRSPAVAAAVVTFVEYVLLTAATIAVGLVLTKVLFGGDKVWDAGPNRWFAQHRAATWNDLSHFGSLAADTLSVIGVAALVALCLGIRRCWRQIAFLALALTLEVTVFLSTTFLVDRPRPPVPRLDSAPPTSSFPSGHTAASTVLYVGLALIVTSRVQNKVVRAGVWILAVVMPLGVGTARMYRGMHFPSDVVTGVVLGLACLAAALFAVQVAVAVQERREVRA